MLDDIGFDPNATLLSISEVEAHDPSAAIALADETQSLFGTFSVAMIVHHDCKAVARNSLRNRAPDSFTRSGD
jgi:hypothetical protein